jgi:tetratricopeptide (TPR) repeat protein
MLVRGVFLIVLVAGSFAALGCAKLAGLMQSADGSPTPATEDECREFADELQKAVDANDHARTSRLIGLAEPYKTAVRDFDGTPEYRRDLLKSCEERAAAHPFVPLLLAKVRNGGQFKLLRVHTEDGRPRAMFRTIRANGTVGYLDFLPARFPDGRLGIEDVYIPAATELFSQSLRRINLAIAAEEGQGPPGHPPTKDRTWTTHLPRWNAMLAAMTAEKWEEAIGIYKSLPETMRVNRTVFLHYVQAALHGSDAEYIRAIEAFRRQFPDDPARKVHAVDYYRMTRQHAAAVEAIEEAERLIGGDPCLRAMRAVEMARAWQFREARALAERAIEEEPTLTWAYMSRIRVSLLEANHPDTLTWMKKMVEATGHGPADLWRDSDFDVFVRSPEYREWQAWAAAHKRG